MHGYTPFVIIGFLEGYVYNPLINNVKLYIKPPEDACYLKELFRRMAAFVAGRPVRAYSNTLCPERSKIRLKNKF